MTDEDAIKVAKIMLTADDWCPSCQCDLIKQLADAFPEHAAAINRVRDNASAIEYALRDSGKPVWAVTGYGVVKE